MGESSPVSGSHNSLRVVRDPLRRSQDQKPTVAALRNDVGSPWPLKRDLVARRPCLSLSLCVRLKERLALAARLPSRRAEMEHDSPFVACQTAALFHTILDSVTSPFPHVSESHWLCRPTPDSAVDLRGDPRSLLCCLSGFHRDAGGCFYVPRRMP